MNTKLFFLVSSLALIVLTVVTICTAPIINRVLPTSPNENCKGDVDKYDYYKEKWSSPTESQKESLNHYKQDANLCKRRKAVYGLEFSSLIIDLVLGTLCCLLGLLHYFDIGKYCLKITGIIGLATGVIGLVLTAIYLGYSSYIFNNDYSRETKLYDNGAILKIVDGVYKYNYNKDDEKENKYYDKAKYKDLGKKQYNYDSKKYKEYLESTDPSSIKACSKEGARTYSTDPVTGQGTFTEDNYEGEAKTGDCEYIWKYNYIENSDNTNKYIYDRWLTSIILSAFICLCNIGVGLFGLLIFLNGDSSSGHSPL